MALIIAFRNISNLAAVSDYEYGVYLNESLLETGKVTGHTRKDGWPYLIQKFLDQRPNPPAPF